MTGLTIGSLFDGIGGFPFAAQRRGITPVWASEIEPSCISITKRHFPDMMHLGDIVKVSGADIEPVDVITFGSPCQDLSIAGKRAGLVGERSWLFVEAIRVINEMLVATIGEYPKFVVFENVPGLISSNSGDDFRFVINELNGLGNGFLIDPNILDAQEFGVAQRRKRVFITCVNIDCLMNNGKMTISESITLQLISELLLNILGVLLKELAVGLTKLDAGVPSRSIDSLNMTINTFLPTQAKTRLVKLRNILDAITEKLAKEQKNSESIVGKIPKVEIGLTDEGMQLSLYQREADEYIDTELSLNKCLDEALRLTRECTILTETKRTTPKIIFTSFQALLNTLKRTVLYASLGLKKHQRYQNYWQWVELHLAESRVYINALKNDGVCSELLGWNEHIWNYDKKLRSVECQFKRDFGGRRAGQILFKRDSLRWNIAPCGAAREGAAGYVEDGAGAADSVGTVDQALCCAAFMGGQGDKAGGIGYQEDVAPTLKSGASGTNLAPTIVCRTDQTVSNGLGVCEGVAFAVNQRDEVRDLNDKAGALQSQPGMKQQTFVVQENPVFALEGNASRPSHKGAGVGEGVMFTLNTVNRHAVAIGIDENKNADMERMGTLQAHTTGGSQNYVATYSEQSLGECAISDKSSTQTARQGKSATDLVTVAGVDCRNATEYEELSATLQAKSNGGNSLNTTHPVRVGAAVRRLLPIECERLQGFPDDWTAYGHDGKPISDSKRYQCIGNSVAVCCVDYIMAGIVALTGDTA